MGLAWPLLGASSLVCCSLEGGAHRAESEESSLWWGYPSPRTALAAVAQARCHQAVTSSLAVQASGWAASQAASASLSEVQVERVHLSEGRLHFQSHHSGH